MFFTKKKKKEGLDLTKLIVFIPFLTQMAPQYIAIPELLIVVLLCNLACASAHNKKVFLYSVVYDDYFSKMWL